MLKMSLCKLFLKTSLYSKKYVTDSLGCRELQALGCRQGFLESSAAQLLNRAVDNLLVRDYRHAFAKSWVFEKSWVIFDR